MKKPFSTGQIIACVIAGVVGIFGIVCVASALSIYSQYARQCDVELMDVEVDFSKPGSFSAPFHQTWRACHGEVIHLELPDGPPAKTAAAHLLKSLAFQWRIADVGGQVVEEGDFEVSEDSGGFKGGRSFRLIYFRPIEIGDYEFQCTVAEGAPALAGISQRLVCKYQPCGMELWPAVILAVIGVPCLLIAGIILLSVRSSRRRESVGNEVKQE